MNIGSWQRARLKQRREYLGWSKKHTAQQIEVSPASVTKHENGDSIPAPEVISKYAEAMGVPASFFYAVPTERGIAHFRARQSISKTEQRKMSAELDWLADSLNLVDEIVELPEPSYPTYNVTVDTSLAIVREIARDVRKDVFKNATTPLTNLVGQLERCGIPIIGHKWQHNKMDGVSIALKRRNFFVINTDGRSAVRQRFSVAHEFGHAVMHQKITEDIVADKDGRKKIEAQANTFASELLMPQTQLPSWVGVRALSDFLRLKLEWGVSVSSIVYNGHDAGLIDRSRYDYLQMDLSRRGWRREEPYDDTMSPEEPSMIRAAWKLIVSPQGLPASEICRRLSLTGRDLNNLFDMPGFFTKKTNSMTLRWRG